MKTPEDAKGLLCPFSRTFGMKEAVPHCRGPECALWRYEQITTAHPLWKAAVIAKAAESDEKPPFRYAAAWVAENKEAVGLVPTRGFCGAGGQP